VWLYQGMTLQLGEKSQGVIFCRTGREAHDFSRAVQAPK
jgi:hypothetical protein